MKFKSPILWVAVLAAAAYLGACGDGSTDITELVPDVPETEDPANGDPTGPIYVAITSHEDAQIITGSRTITLAGTVTSATEITAATITATLNDGDPVTVDVDEGAFSVDLTLGDRDNVLAVLAEYKGESHEATLSLNYPFLAFTNGQDAAVVIGQTDFESSDFPLSATGMRNPWGNPVVANNTLYVSDTEHNRILGYHEIPTANGATADFVLGQSDFTSDDASLTQGGLSNPRSISIQGETMAVADHAHNRVLIYHGLPTTTGAHPDVVVGQQDFETSGSACDATGLSAPDGVWLTNEKLVVSDRNNGRILIWNGIPTDDGAPADLVLGQEALDTCDYITGASGLNWPIGVWSDGERVVVADSSNYRVLIWNTFPTTNGQAADVVLGQEDMDATANEDPSASSLAFPSAVSSNGNQLFVGDCGRRVLIWDAFPEENNVPADRVLGSADFENPPGGTTQSSLNCVGGVHATDTQLLVADPDSVRVMIFDAP